MPAFFGAAVAFGGAMLAGIGYLRTRETCYDSFAVAGVEVGLTLALVNLVSGASGPARSGIPGGPGTRG